GRGVKAAVAWVVPHLIGRWYLGNERDQVAVQRVDDLEWPRSGATDQQVLERPEREAGTVAIGERVRGIDCSCPGLMTTTPMPGTVMRKRPPCNWASQSGCSAPVAPVNETLPSDE